MVTMAPRLTFGTSVADWQERLNVERLRRERAEKARAVLRKRGLAAILAARPENTRYLTGLKGPEFQPALWYVLFFAEGEPVVFHHAGWIHHYPSQVPWITQWRLARAWLSAGAGPEAADAEAKLFAEGIARELSDRGVAKEQLAVIGFDGRAQRALAEKGIKTVDGAPVMLDATETKTEDEISCLKMAFAISDAAWNAAWETMRPGARDVEVSRAMIAAAQAAGAEDVPPCRIRSGPIAFDRAYDNSGRILNFGDLAYGSTCSLTYMGYKACYYRTFSVGRAPDKRATEWYERLVDRMDRVIDKIRPGNTTRDAALEFAPASKWGLRDEAELLTLEIGHGVGMLHYGYPIINRLWSLDHPQEFKVGMTIAVEGREGEEGIGAVRLEDAVVVTEKGAELIDHWPRDEILVAPRA